MRVNSSSVFQEDYRALFICKKGTVILVGVVLKSKARNTRGITLSSFFFFFSFFFTLITKNHRTICFLHSSNNFKRSRLKGGNHVYSKVYWKGVVLFHLWEFLTSFSYKWKALYIKKSKHLGSI